MSLVNPQSLDHLTTVTDRFERKVIEPIPQKYLKLLSNKDRLLIELAAHKSLTCRQLGNTVGVSPGTASRRVRQLYERLNDPLVKAVADATSTLGPGEREVGLQYFLHRVPIAHLSQKYQMTRGKVRAIVQFLRGMAPGALRNRRELTTNF